MSALRSHTGAKTSTPLFDCGVDHALVQAFPFHNDALPQLVHILDFPAVNPLPTGLRSGLFEGQSDGGMKSGVSRLSSSTVSLARCRILLECEVIRKLFDIIKY